MNNKIFLVNYLLDAYWYRKALQIKIELWTDRLMDRQSLLKSSFATKSIYYENEILTSNSHTLKTIYSHLLISKNYPIKK